MKTETERKFLLKDPSWRPPVKPVALSQGYYKLGEADRGRIEHGPSGYVFVLNENAKIPLTPDNGPEAQAIAAAHGGFFPAGWKARIRCEDGNYMLDLKGPRTGASRGEMDKNHMPRDIGEMLLMGCGKTILHKQRYNVLVAGKIWAVDVYAPPYEGLVVAEVELDYPGEPITLADWAGREITDEKLFGGVWAAVPPAALKP